MYTKINFFSHFFLLALSLYFHNFHRSTVAASRFCLGSSVLTELPVRSVSLADFLKSIAPAVGIVGGGWKAQKLLFTRFRCAISLSLFFNFTSSAFGICLCRPAAVWRQKCFPILVWHPVSSLFMFGYYTDTCCCCMLVITNSFWDMRTVAFADVIGVWFGVNALVCVSFRHPLAKHWQLLFICCLLLLL